MPCALLSLMAFARLTVCFFFLTLANLTLTVFGSFNSVLYLMPFERNPRAFFQFHSQAVRSGFHTLYERKTRRDLNRPIYCADRRFPQKVPLFLSGKGILNQFILPYVEHANVEGTCAQYKKFSWECDRIFLEECARWETETPNRPPVSAQSRSS